MMDWLVSVAILGAAAYVGAWIFSPAVRAWSERPKYRFQAMLERFDK
jgi:hypothetical protein